MGPVLMGCIRQFVRFTISINLDRYVFLLAPTGPPAADAPGAIPGLYACLTYLSIAPVRPAR